MMSRYNPFANSLLSMSKLMHVSAAPPGHSAKCFTRTPESKPGRLGQTQTTPRQLSASNAVNHLGLTYCYQVLNLQAAMLLLIFIRRVSWIQSLLVLPPS